MASVVEAVVGPHPPLLQRQIERIAGPEARHLRSEKLSATTQRLWLADGSTPSLVIKRLSGHASALNAAAAERWMPAFGLRRHGPPLLAVIDEPVSEWVWHIYGDNGADLGDARWNELIPLVDLVASLHRRATGHQLLPEVTKLAGERSEEYLLSNLAKAIDQLTVLQVTPGADATRPICIALLDKLAEVDRGRARRVASIARFAGRHTLLHGDLWPKNALDDIGKVRLIDWDRAAVGPAAFDLSVLIRRIRLSDREAALARYVRFHPIFPQGTTLNDIDFLFETFEISRITHDISSHAGALLSDPAAWWAHEGLRRSAEWLNDLRPLFTGASLEKSL